MNQEFMTTQIFYPIIGAGVLLLLSIIAFFVRNLISEQRKTREEVTEILIQQAEDNAKFKHVQDSLIQLQKSDTALMEKLTDVVERLTRLEEKHNAHG